MALGSPPPPEFSGGGLQAVESWDECQCLPPSAAAWGRVLGFPGGSGGCGRSCPAQAWPVGVVSARLGASSPPRPSPPSPGKGEALSGWGRLPLPLPLPNPPGGVTPGRRHGLAGALSQWRRPSEAATQRRQGRFHGAFSRPCSGLSFSFCPHHPLR